LGCYPNAPPARMKGFSSSRRFLLLPGWTVKVEFSEVYQLAPVQTGVPGSPQSAPGWAESAKQVAMQQVARGTWVAFERRPSPFASSSSLRRPPRREGIASAGAGAPARRTADAPTALTGGPVLRSSPAEGGLGNPGPTVQSRDCPSLLLGGCSRRSGRLVVAGTARVAGVLLGNRSGTGPAAIRGGS
jgi:hypothetical protein